MVRIASINVNGLDNKTKRQNTFRWLVKKHFDIVLNKKRTVMIRKQKIIGLKIGVVKLLEPWNELIERGERSF